MDKTSELILPGVHYFQVVFTLPDRLSGLILGNRRELYALLFHSAWKSLDTLLRRTGRFYPAAQMVLHTWNQQLGHHPHIHAIVPGGGPALDGQRWITSRHPKQRRRRKPFLVDHEELGRLFREAFVQGLHRLAKRGALRLEGDWSRFQDSRQLEAWLKDLEQTDWNVFVEGPPKGISDPRQVLKYLARYLTGGPISNRRIVRDEGGMVTFTARSKDKEAGNPLIEVELPGHAFVRCWSLHILPKGFTKSRSYGGYHPSQRPAYLEQCRRLLPQVDTPSDASRPAEPNMESEKRLQCPRCEVAMDLIVSKPRPSWQEVFHERSYSRHNMVLPIHGLGRQYIRDD
jgi:Putative transposase